MVLESISPIDILKTTSRQALGDHNPPSASIQVAENVTGHDATSAGLSSTTANRQQVALDNQRSKADGAEEDEDESLALARRLMAEEAMASYEYHFSLMRQSTEFLSAEDLAAYNAIMAEDQEGTVPQDDWAELEDNEGNVSYETLLHLGELIGDVKTERWTMHAQRVIEKMPSFQFRLTTLHQSRMRADDSESKCLVCQCEYEDGEQLRRLPCGHCFHMSCVDQWLRTKDVCPYCRQPVLDPSTGESR